MEKLLPNGTIVLLKGGNKRLMIYGRKQLIVDNDQEEAAEGKPADGTMYDYLGVFYPEGYINQEYTYVFNHTDIIDRSEERRVGKEGRARWSTGRCKTNEYRAQTDEKD